MARKRHEDDRACGCHQGDPSCVALAVRRLSQERVLELAEEIWTASGGDGTPPTRTDRGCSKARSSGLLPGSWRCSAQRSEHRSPEGEEMRPWTVTRRSLSTA
jgi:hypothetical protein